MSEFKQWQELTLRGIEAVNHFLEEKHQKNQTYALHHYIVDASYALTHLTGQQVAQYIYTYGGEDYLLSPKIRKKAVCADEQVFIEIQETTQTGDLIFDVFFKTNSDDRTSLFNKKSRRIAIGKTEEEAEKAFLQDSFDRMAWDESCWYLFTMDEYNGWRVSE